MLRKSRPTFKARFTIICLMALMGLSLILSACGDNTPTASSTTSAATATTTTQATTSAATTTAAATTTTSATTAATSGTTTAAAQGDGIQVGSGNITLHILIHQNKPFVDFMNKMDALFEQKYPNIKVDLSVVAPSTLDQAIQTRLSANNVDLFETTQAFTNAPQSYMSGVADPEWLQWIKGGLLEDLTSQPFTKYYDPNALQSASTYNGKVYSITTCRYAYSGVFYNKAIFQQYNLQVPTTWNDFVTLCQTLQSKGIAPMTGGGKDGWPIGVVGPAAGLLLSLYPDQQNLVQGLWNSSVKFTDSTSEQYFERGKQLLGFYEKGVASIDYQTAPGRFAAGKAAMYPGGTWDAPTIVQANPNIQLGYFPFPGSDSADNNKTLSGKYDVAWFVPAKAQAKQAALAWLDFFSQPENYANYANATGILPSEPNVNLTASYTKDIQPYLPTFKVAFSEMMLAPKNVGKYAGFSLTNFTPFGDVSDAQTLAQKAQADWQSALQK